MAYYKPLQLKKSGKWFPSAVIIDQPFETSEVADRLAAISTVSKADVVAVLAELPGVMSDMMNAGRSVRLDGLGTFRYTINAERNGVDTADEVSAAQIRGVRVRYIPETRRPTRAGNVTRPLVPEKVRWTRYDGTPVSDGGSEPTEPGGGDGEL